MASLRHSTPKVSAFQMYTRNKKLADVPERKVVQAKPVTEKAKTKKSNLDVKATSLRKRKVDIVEIVNGTASDDQVVKAKRGRKKKVVQEEIPVVKNSHSDDEQELEAEEVENESEKAEEDDVSFCFKQSTSPDISVSRRQTVACGNEAAEEAFRWLLSPTKPEVFFAKKWEKKPFLIKRSNSNYYKGLYSVKEFEKTVDEHFLNYNSEIDVVAYVDGERKPLINDKRVFSSYLWAAFKEGYSIRMRNPQAYSKALGSLCSLLQEYFSSFVGANMYLTPADTQGFPPHYDDIDAFILQIEGKKLWKLYTPSEKDMLARVSSPDLCEDDIGEPYMEVELNPGDMLYFPRGYIHQAKAAPGMHSMHITLSTNQLNTWGDFLEHALTNAIEDATENDIEFRKSIPKDYLNYMGRIYSDTDSKERRDFQKTASSLIEKTLQYVSVDYAADAHGISFIHGSMPPDFSEKEKAHSVHGNGASFNDGRVLVSPELSPEIKIRLIRRRAFNLVVDVDEAKLFHTMYNTKNHKEKEVNYIEVDLDTVPAIVALFKAHPDYVQIKDLPHENRQVLMACLQQLYDNGFLMTEEPLPFDED
ncbi:Ribosomal oxygenase 1 [Araneus ventricosus]|uniref:Bifunctional lysine-specific demethylase and histidyl-hydroxylase n=1 Tax=Araneus ventricosus TaxID=182803 RepID=A0A4Y2JGB0_ARAVE|nr:Ribosomal oxygenase 1 [Araneus ventricosus]